MTITLSSMLATIGLSGNDLTVVPVPEPSAFALFGFVAVIVGGVVLLVTSLTKRVGKVAIKPQAQPPAQPAPRTVE